MTTTEPNTIADRLKSPALDHASRDFARVLVHSTVARALSDIHESHVQSRIVYIYVVDVEGVLRGVVPTRRLLLSPPETPIEEIMVKNVATLGRDATLLDACEMFILHRLLALPIVDERGRILGVIDVDEYTDEIRQLDAKEQSAEIFQLIGVHLGDVRKATLPKLFAGRFPWLLCNVAGGLACAAIASSFENLLGQVLILAAFIPVVLALSESVSIQSLTLVLQKQHGREAAWSEIARGLLRELPLGLLLGGACGALVGAFAWLWGAGIAAAACIFASIALSVMLAAAFGILVPLLLRKLQRDPQVAAGPITLAMTDIVALTLYLGQGTIWLL